MIVYNYEDMVIWQMSRTLVKEIYILSTDIRDFGFNSQIQRAAISIMNNIAEGFERNKYTQDNKTFAYFLNISFGSCGEVRSMLYVAEDLQYIDTSKAKQLRDSCQSISRKIEALMKKLETVNIKPKM
jgi:four helix bundle protein